jgi:hypothetical protein
VKARGAILFLCAASAATRAEEPTDYFANLRDKTFVEVDQAYLVKEEPALPESPVLFRIRHLFLRVKMGTGDAERRWWPVRSLLLVEAASGNRFVAEITADIGDQEHPDAPKAWTRLSGASRGLAVESWASPDPHERELLESWHPSKEDEPLPEPDEACGGTRYRFLGGGLEFGGAYLPDFHSRTVSIALVEIRDAVFSADEVRELDRLRSLEISRLSGASGTAVNFQSGVRLAWSFLFMDRPNIPRNKRDLVLVPDATPPGDLASWRTLTYLPQDLPPFPAFLPESPIQ